MPPRHCSPWCSPSRREPNRGPQPFASLACCWDSRAPSWSWPLGELGIGAGSLSGQAACLLAAASYGVSYVYMRRFLTGRGLPPLALAASQLTVATALLALGAPIVARTPITLTGDVVASILALGALGTGIAYLLNYRLIADEGATAASTVT